MLQDKYLLISHFRQKHTVTINASAEHVWSLIRALDVGGLALIRLLFTLRGLPTRMTNRDGRKKDKLVLLEQVENEELIIGLIGQFWKINLNLQEFKPEEFVCFSEPGFTRGTWNFRIIPQGINQVLLETETRVFCADNEVMEKFSSYWLLVKPFRAMIGKKILNEIKRKAELKPKT